METGQLALLRFMEARSNMKPQEKIINITTGETTFQDMSDEDIAYAEKLTAQLHKEMIENEKKDKIRQSALAKLIDLGLTEEEIATL